MDSSSPRYTLDWGYKDPQGDVQVRLIGPQALKKGAQGMEINFLYDGWTNVQTREAAEKGLRAAGLLPEGESVLHTGSNAPPE